MVFSSVVFLGLFLPVVFVVHRILGFIGRLMPFNKSGRLASLEVWLQNIWLLVASLLFYAWGEPRFVFIMVFSIAVNYLFGILVGISAKKLIKKSMLIAALISNLAILGYFKYFSTALSLLERISGADIGSVINIVLPIGISFYTFQAISYIIDVYRGVNEPQKNILLLALYITLFPQLVAGPIVKYNEIDTQLKCRTVSSSKTIKGIKRFIYGLCKKVLIANQMALVVDQIFALSAQDLSTSLAWAGALMYTLQIYFTRYLRVDMAIGLGLMFGFKFPENFNLPYLSTSIREFWRRWHISLSSWFREYLYIPLGGNRKGKARTYLNLVVVFFVTGVWHGAGVSFVAWGLFHGLFIVAERAGLDGLLKRIGFANRVYVVFVVVIGWVMFRADTFSLSLEYYRAMFMPSVSVSYNFFEIVPIYSCLVFFVGILMCGPLQAFVCKIRRGSEPKDFMAFCTVSDVELSGCGQMDVIASGRSEKYQVMQFVLLLFLLVVCLVDLTAGSYNPFIYFRF